MRQGKTPVLEPAEARALIDSIDVSTMRASATGAVDFTDLEIRADEISRIIKEQIKDTFGKYIDPRIVSGLLERPDLTAAGGERRVMTVSFCDTRGFTTLSESLTPPNLVNVINHYLTLMSEPVRLHEGIIDKYIGDAIMAYWGPPFAHQEAQGRLACLAAMIATDAKAQSPGAFAGKTVTMYIGFGPGGGYDMWARVVAARSTFGSASPPATWSSAISAPM